MVVLVRCQCIEHSSVSNNIIDPFQQAKSLLEGKRQKSRYLCKEPSRRKGGRDAICDEKEYPRSVHGKYGHNHIKGN